MKTDRIVLRADPELKEALRAAAGEDGRSVSNLIERILIEWLNAHGESQE